MKILVRSSPSSGQQLQAENQTSYNIPNTTITWVTVAYLIISVLANSIGNYISSKPQRDIDKNDFSLKDKNLQIQLLQRVLEADSAKDRMYSLQLLIATGLIKEIDKGTIYKLVDANKYIPQWPKRDLEPLSSYLGYEYSNPDVSSSRISKQDTGLQKPEETGFGSDRRKDVNIKK